MLRWIKLLHLELHASSFQSLVIVNIVVQSFQSIVIVSIVLVQIKKEEQKKKKKKKDIYAQSTVATF